MEWKTFWQFSLFSGYFSFIILEFYVLGFSEMTFLITFILAMFTILISALFFIKSNDTLFLIKEGVKDIARGVGVIGDGIELIESSPDFKRLKTKKWKSLKKISPLKRDKK